MSLLLEALKKAERAKEEAQRRGQAEKPETTLAVPAAPAPEPAPEPQAEPVRTREQLPEIGTPLELLADEPEPRRPGPPAAPRAETKAEPRPTERAAANDRAAARKVFEAKFREPNPRLPFFITIGALGVFAVGSVIYFWIQLRPPAPLVNLNPQPPGGEVQVAAAPQPRPPAPPPVPPAQSAIPGLPAAAAAAAPAPLPKPAPQAPVARAPEIPRLPETPLLKPQPRVVAPVAPAPAESQISASRPAPQVHPKVSSAYGAYLAGELGAARTDYQEVLREEPSNRDALLGLAAIDVRGGRFEAAESAYLRLLQADPRDAHAQAALIALRAGRVDPVAAESRVKLMLADNPGAAVLNFTLGNQLAQQGRWAEAQQEYFKALSAEPDNPDFAYNLAVSLDHLRQPRLALDYYRRALALAKARGASFDHAAAQSRAAQLGR